MTEPGDMERDLRRYLGLRPHHVPTNRLRGSATFLHSCILHYGPAFSDWVDRMRRHLGRADEVDFSTREEP